MTPPVRPEIDPSAAIAALKSQGAPDEAIHAYLVSKGFQPVQEEPLVSRVAHGVVGTLGQMVAHPLDTAAGMVKGAGSSLMDAVLSPGIGEARPDARLSKGGNSSGRPIDTSPYDAAHGGITPGQRTAAGLQAASTLAFPSIASGVAGKLGGGVLAKAAGLATAGGTAGAAQSPTDPVAGGLTGAILAPAFGAAGKLGGGVGSKAIDVVGRPMESRPLIRSAPFLGNIEGVTDRAARLNAPALDATPPLPNTMKPMAPVDRGIPAQRLARGLKTSSPAAEATFRGALEPREDQAITRVIDHAKELTGIKQKDAFTTHQELKANTLQQGDEAYGKVWNSEAGNRLVDVQDVLETPAGQQAWTRAKRMMANDGVSPATKTVEIPGVDSPELKQMVDLGVPRERALAVLGDKAMTTASKTVEVPTLRQAHYLKLALDDLKEPGLNKGPGDGGIGYNEGRSIHGVQKGLLAKMDEASPEYAAARKQFADNKTLEKASDFGQEHWSRDPVESKALLNKMTPGEQQLYRDQAFDKWATRTENGPENVAKGQGKDLNQKRLRLLFPDDASFASFKEGLKHEATMHASTKGVLSGSTTADKLSDMADMAGVALPDVFKAMRGNPLPLIAKGAKAIVGPRLREGAERLSAERARLLTAGADGTRSVQNSLSKGALVQAITGRPRGLPDGHDPTLPEVLDPSRGVNRQPPSAAVQSIRQQVDEMNRKQFVQAHHPKRY